MVFISHNSKDKPIVEPVAIKLATIFGQDKVFYDSWSIQPGDGIIDKMNEGLLNCKYFFYFVSANSLTSTMVKMEWQNALFRAAQNVIKFIPVRLDQSVLPPIMMQTLYIDLFSNGIEVALRQMIDVVNGSNTFTSTNPSFSNLVAYKYRENGKLIVECRALYYLEPISNFSFLSFNDVEKVGHKVRGENMHTAGSERDIPLNNGLKANFITLGLGRGTLPGFPFIAEFTSNNNLDFDVVAVLHQTSSEYFSPIPMFDGRPRK